MPPAGTEQACMCSGFPTQARHARSPRPWMPIQPWARSLHTLRIVPGSSAVAVSQLTAWLKQHLAQMTGLESVDIHPHTQGMGAELWQVLDLLLPASVQRLSLPHHTVPDPTAVERRAAAAAAEAASETAAAAWAAAAAATGAAESSQGAEDGAQQEEEEAAAAAADALVTGQDAAAAAAAATAAAAAGYLARLGLDTHAVQQAQHGAGPSRYSTASLEGRYAALRGFLKAHGSITQLELTGCVMVNQGREMEAIASLPGLRKLCGELCNTQCWSFGRSVHTALHTNSLQPCSCPPAHVSLHAYPIIHVRRAGSGMLGRPPRPPGSSSQQPPALGAHPHGSRGRVSAVSVRVLCDLGA